MEIRMSLFGEDILRSESLPIGAILVVIKSSLTPNLAQITVLAHSECEGTGFNGSTKMRESVPLIHPQCSYDGLRKQHPTDHQLIARKGRSEERRVGKECRSR